MICVDDKEFLKVMFSGFDAEAQGLTVDQLTTRMAAKLSATDSNARLDLILSWFGPVFEVLGLKPKTLHALAKVFVGQVKIPSEKELRARGKEEARKAPLSQRVLHRRG